MSQQKQQTTQNGAAVLHFHKQQAACIRHFGDFPGNRIEGKTETVLNVKFTQNCVVFGTETDTKTYTVSLT